MTPAPGSDAAIDRGCTGIGLSVSAGDVAMITFETAYAIASAHQEIERAEDLMKKTQEAVSRRQQPDIRDAFGRSQGGLQLGVPSGDNSTRLYNVEWSLCVPVLRAHIGQMKAKLDALNEIARTELGE